MRYYPNYRLGPIDGSSCDTLGLDNHPLAHFRYDVEDTLSPAQLTFTDLSSYEPATWSWDFGDPASGAANMSSDTSPVHIFSGPGVYQVCQTVCNVNSCDTECKEVVIGTSAPLSPPEGGRLGFEVFPNPVEDIVQIRRASNLDMDWKFDLFDVAGRLVFTSPSFGGSEGRLSLKALPEGLYFYTIKEQAPSGFQQKNIQKGKLLRID